MKTSKLKLRPFISWMNKKTGDKEFDSERKRILQECGADKREPFATLTYKNVSIELDYTIFRFLELNTRFSGYDRAKLIFNLGKNEILTEMMCDIEGDTKVSPVTWFRDNPKKCSITHPLSPLAREDDNFTCLEDGRRNMEWEKLDSKEDDK